MQGTHGKQGDPRVCVRAMAEDHGDQLAQTAGTAASHAGAKNITEVRFVRM